MSITEEIRIKGDTSDADKKIDNLSKNVGDLSKKAEDVGNNLGDSFDKASKGTEKATKKVGSLSNGFKKLGTAIKATGIGLVVSLFASLTVAVSNNQRAIDIFSTAFRTVSIVLNEVVNAMFAVYDSVSKNTENFDALGKVLKGLLTVGITPLKLSFYAIKLGIQQAQLAWEDSFFGGKDKEKIKELTLGILETKEAIYGTGKDAVDAAKDIYNNFSEAIDETTNIVKKSQEELSKISIKNSYELAKQSVKLENNAKLAAARQQQLVEIYDRQAEKLRQLRDDESKSITDRIKSNEDLNNVLKQQEEAMIKTADAQIAAANIALQQNNTIENRVALIDALANKEGVLAQIEGFRSEQLANRISLLKEQQEIENLSKDSTKERQIAEKEFEAEREENESKKLELQKERLDLEYQLLKEDLERKRELYAEDTLAREQAEQDFLNSKQRIEQERTRIEDKEGKIRKQKEKQLQDAKLAFASNTLDMLGGILKEGSDLAKGVAAAQATISGIEGVQNAFTSGAKNPITTFFPAFPFVQAGLAGVFSVAQVAKILSTDSSGKSVSSGGGSVGSGIQAPSFNLVQGTAENQIAESIQQQNATPVRAFVVSRSVTSAQEMDRNIEDRASI